MVIMASDGVSIKRGSGKLYEIISRNVKYDGMLVSETLDCTTCEHIKAANIIEDSVARHIHDSNSIVGVCTLGRFWRVVIKRKKQKRCQRIVAIEREKNARN